MKEITFKPTVFSTQHKLIIDPDFIEIYNSPEDKNPTKFSKLEIDKIRYGVRAVRGLSYYVGKVYCIDIKNTTDKIIRIRFRSFYSIKSKDLNEKFYLIINSVAANYFSDNIYQYCKMLDAKLPFSILNIHFNQSGISLKDKYSIKWEELRLKSFSRYLTISSKTDSKLYKTFDWLTEWNVIILYNVMRTALKNKNLLND